MVGWRCPVPKQGVPDRLIGPLGPTFRRHPSRFCQKALEHPMLIGRSDCPVWTRWTTRHPTDQARSALFHLVRRPAASLESSSGTTPTRATASSNPSPATTSSSTPAPSKTAAGWQKVRPSSSTSSRAARAPGRQRAPAHHPLAAPPEQASGGLARWPAGQNGRCVGRVARRARRPPWPQGWSRPPPPRTATPS
jgi:hypothetical protein